MKKFRPFAELGNAEAQTRLGTMYLRSDDLPPRHVSRMVSPDGRARVQTFPRENLEDHAAFERFVAAVQAVDPNVTGVPVNLVEFARITQQAFRQATAMAVLMITAMLWILWRRVAHICPTSALVSITSRPFADRWSRTRS